jgi:hypothetical protein
MTVSAPIFDASAPLPAHAQQFELQVAAVESHGQALSAALRRHEPLQVALCAQALQTALLAAQNSLRTGATAQPMPAALHQRLAVAAARATVCREAVHRTVAAQARELHVLLPDAAAAGATYGAHGLPQTDLSPVAVSA